MVRTLKLVKAAAVERNAAWAQGLGLCPLFAVTTSIENAAALAAASGVVLVGAAAAVAALRSLVPADVRLPCFVLIIATLTASVTMLAEAFAFDVYTRVALFLQLVVTNCMILGRMEQFASRNPVPRATLDALGTALGFAFALLALGAVREALAGAVPLAALAPGGFIVAGLLLALGRAATARTRREPRRVRPDGAASSTRASRQTSA